MQEAVGEAASRDFVLKIELWRIEMRSCTQQGKKGEKRRQTREILFSFAPTRPPRERKEGWGFVMLGVQVQDEFCPTYRQLRLRGSE